MRVAIIAYSDSARTVTLLNYNGSKSDLQRAITAASYTGGDGTNVTQALLLLNQAVMVKANGARDIAVKAAFIIAGSGLARDSSTVSVANRLKYNGVVILGLGIGLTPDGVTQLNSLVTLSSTLVQISQYNQLNDALDRAVQLICNASECVNNNAYISICCNFIL